MKRHVPSEECTMKFLLGCLPEGHKGTGHRLLVRLLLLLKNQAPQLLHSCRPELQSNPVISSMLWPWLTRGWTDLLTPPFQ